MKKTIMMFSVVLACYPLGIKAQISDSHRQATEEFLSAIDVDLAVKFEKDTQLKELLVGFVNSPCVTREEAETLKADLQQELSFHRLKPYYVNVLASAFSEEEIRKMTAFYSTPLGKRAIRDLPNLLNKANAGSVLEITRQGNAIGEKLQKFASPRFNIDGTCRNKHTNGP